MTTDTKPLTVEDIRVLLIKYHGYTPEEAAQIKGKTNLTKLLTECEKANVDLEHVEEVVEETENIIGPRDKGWTQYVLSQLEKDEMIDGNPTTDGLLRLAEDYLGSIESIIPVVIQAPHVDNNNRATVQVTVTFSENEQYGGVADVCRENTDSPYHLHPTATAETRALGRALRRALRLKKIITAEENAGIINEVTGDDTRITNVQIKMIDNQASTKNINILNVLKQMNIPYTNVTTLSYSEAQDICRTLNGYKKESVPDTLLGYDANWQFKEQKE